MIVNELGKDVSTVGVGADASDVEETTTDIDFYVDKVR